MNTNESKKIPNRIQKIQNDSKRIQKNPKESKRIQMNPKKSKRIQKILMIQKES